MTDALAFAGVSRQAELIRAGDVDPVSLVELTLERIARIDPQLNAFRVVFSDQARVEAERAAVRVRLGEELPLLGVPVAVKDDLAVEGQARTLGSRAYGGPEPADALAVRRLREAGAIIIGITRVPELCIWPFTETLAGGITRNPWNLDRTPGGSSGGSGAAVAAGLVGMATASDGAGSIRIPASWNGLFGLKPTRDLVPTDPAVAPWRGLTSYGVLTRTVADTALGLEVMSGTSLVAAARQPVRPLRIALSVRAPLPTPVPVDPAWRYAAQSTGELLESLGHTVEEREVRVGPKTVAAVVARYLTGVADDAEAMAFPDRLERRTRGMARLGAGARRVLPRVERWDADVMAECSAVFDDFDVLLTPALAQPPQEVGTWEGMGALRTLEAATRRVPFSPMWNVAGFPAASVPAGLDGDDLPRAVQLVAPAGQDALLLALSAQIEEARPWADALPPVR
ncbi:MAG: amidase [Solirubrobacteraceae bacterium]|nr:amidase [Solirubrobacteraceae bacterium]